MQSIRHVLVFVEQHAIKPGPPVLARMCEQLNETLRRLDELGHRQNRAHGPIGVRRCDGS
jgi:hypothetical protein